MVVARTDEGAERFRATILLVGFEKERFVDDASIGRGGMERIVGVEKRLTYENVVDSVPLSLVFVRTRFFVFHEVGEALDLLDRTGFQSVVEVACDDDVGVGRNGLDGIDDRKNGPHHIVAVGVAFLSAQF